MSTLYRQLIDRASSMSSKRAMAIWSIRTLITCALSIGGCIAYRIIVDGDVGAGAVGAFTAVTVPLAGLAGFNYRKADGKTTEQKAEDQKGAERWASA